MTQFMLLSSTFVSENYPTAKYKSERTGLTVILTNMERPAVQCCFKIVTEPENDDGYVHALEHLIFNGSKQYPYRGILNKLAEDAVGWSDMDFTIFNYSASDQDCALAALPIFFDHIMFPLLSEEDYILDVHHIDGNGEDGGLVYEEMKDAYLTPFKSLIVNLQKKMCPNSGYAFDYCGSEFELRTCTSYSKVKKFHEKFYRLENITIIATGQINHGDFLKKLAEVEDEIIAKKKSDPEKEWIKPWQAIPSPPNYGEYNYFHSPECLEDGENPENNGYMLFGWRGPVLTDVSSIKDLTACEILLNYLSLEPSAPLYKCLVAAKEPLAGIASTNMNYNKVSILRLDLFDIPVEKLDQARNTTLGCVKSIRNGDTSLDMERIQDLVQKMLEEIQNDFELDPHHQITLRCLFCFYLDTEEFPAIMNPQKYIKELLEGTSDYWLSIFRKYFTDDVVIVTSIPAGLENVKIEEKERIDKQRELLGEQGLAEKAKLLEEAKKFRERPLPLLKDFLPLSVIEKLNLRDDHGGAEANSTVNY